MAAAPDVLQPPPLSLCVVLGVKWDQYWSCRVLDVRGGELSSAPGERVSVWDSIKIPLGSILLIVS